MRQCNRNRIDQRLRRLVDLVGLGHVLASDGSVDLRRRELRMTQKILYRTEVGAVLEEVGGVGVAEGVDVGLLADAASLQRGAKRALEAGAGDRAGVGGNGVVGACSP